MSDTIKTLAQSYPSGSTLTDLYTVGVLTSTAVSSIVVCNQTSSTLSFRISIAVAGAADATKQYLYYDQTLTGNNTFVATIGITLATTDIVRIYASSVGLSFNLFGVEVT